jgi:hypothetical protein
MGGRSLQEQNLQFLELLICESWRPAAARPTRASPKNRFHFQVAQSPSNCNPGESSRTGDPRHPAVPQRQGVGGSHQPTKPLIEVAKKDLVLLR